VASLLAAWEPEVEPLRHVAGELGAQLGARHD
jgi:hypothetical protein